MLADLKRYFERYAALSPGLPLVLALWVIATHLFDVFDAFPYLAITSPTKRCGKTRVAELLELVCAKPRRTVGISPAALFRVTEKEKPTWIVDEAESLRGKGERADSLREILNAGYRKGQKVIRCFGGNGKDYKTRDFETFCPKVIVLIGSLPDTLADRCIPVQMKRRTNEKLGRFRFQRVKKESQPLCKATGQWASKNRRAVRSWYQNNDVGCLQDREAELWLPLFAVCAVAAPDRLPELESIALKLSGTKTATEPGDLGIKLLADIRNQFGEEGADRLSTEVLLSKLNADKELPWCAWNHGKGLNPHNLGRMLVPFGIRPGTVRFTAGDTAKGYYRDDFTEVWACYLSPSEKRHSVTTQTEPSENGDSASVTLGGCDGTDSAISASVDAGCDGVTEGNPTLSETC
jgi:hypothetical protein